MVLGAALTFGACTTTGSKNAASRADAARTVDAAAVARIDSTLGGFIESGTLAGVSALVYEKGREVYYNAFGMADREAGVPMARNTLVQIFSMTKPITGVALMQLYEQGAFELDDQVSKYAPEFADLRVYAGEDASGTPILEAPHRAMTIRDLTRHTAGFANGGNNPGVGPLLSEANPMDRTHTLAEMAERLAGVPLWFHPGERWEYGLSVDVQAFLVERLSGQPFDEYLREHILAPLGMTETRYFIPESDRDRFAALYQRSDDGTLTHVPDEDARSFNTNRWPLTPGGFGLTSTLDDYMRFARMLVNEGELDGVRILEPETVKLMATSHLSEDVEERSWLPSKGQVGFGIDFAVRVRPPASARENNGVVGEFFWDGAASTLFWVDPVNDLAAVLFVQLMPFDRVGLHKGFRDAVYGPYVPLAGGAGQ
jgi:CubicO group peptidase (beta-lactamase class C family)